MMEVDKKKTRTDEAWVRLYARFETDCLLPADAEHASATHRRLYLKWGSVSAAVIAGIVCFAAWWAVPEQGGDSRSLLTEENREKPTLVKTLEDGSVVYLAQESTLKYPEHFAEDKREVNLQGEAFFDVAKKPEQAFTIETARVRVEVLGTAFNVNAYREDAYAEVTLMRGAVKLTDSRKQIVELLPDQQVNLSDGGLIGKKQVEAWKYSAWTEGLLVLEGEPIQRVFDRLSRYYGESIVIDVCSQALTIRGMLDLNCPLDEVLDRISVIAPINVVKTSEGYCVTEK